MGPTWVPCRPHESLLRRHNGRDVVSNHQPHCCLLNRLFRRWSKKTSKFRVTGLCAGISQEIGEFPAQRASNAENVSIWWRHHVLLSRYILTIHPLPGKPLLLQPQPDVQEEPVQDEWPQGCVDFRWPHDGQVGVPLLTQTGAFYFGFGAFVDIETKLVAIH